ncbi:putative short-chain dehydrogenases/reductase [Abortiporus biennis]|nr:putative short-chain dehydrogenases/reductase [Abortiporus biennis]
MPSYLITGASRGIGLGLATELLKNPENQVIATARSPETSQGLQELRQQYANTKQLFFLPLDISKPETITKAAQEAEKLLPNGLDVLISNGGILRNATATWEEIDTDEFLEELGLNTISILQLLRAFRPLVAKSSLKKVIVITSASGSIGLLDHTPNIAMTYGVGKAALNMLVRRWGKVYKEEGITTHLIHPGWVATTMGLAEVDTLKKLFPGTSPISVEESTTNIVKLIDEVKLADSVQFFSHDGTTLPW